MFQLEENLLDFIRLIGLWIISCLSLPAMWWVSHDEWILPAMLRSSEGLAFFAVCFLLAIASTALHRRRRQRAEHEFPEYSK